MGTKGPIVLAPGYGNAARAFALDTVPKNYAQYLGEHGYDVWLLDYRASPDLPSSFTQFTVDDIAMRDWPAAIAHVRQRDRRRTRCRRWATASAGSRCSWRSAAGWRACAAATFSALAGHPIPTPGNQLRAGARLATLFKQLGIKGLNTDYRPGSLPDRAIEAVMQRAARSGTSTTARSARRIYFIYGDVFDYERIDEATMDAVGAELLRQRQHHVLRAHLADDPQEQGASTRRAATPTSSNPDALPDADLVHHRRAQPDVRPAWACSRPTTAAGGERARALHAGT